MTYEAVIIKKTFRANYGSGGPFCQLFLANNKTITGYGDFALKLNNFKEGNTIKASGGIHSLP